MSRLESLPVVETFHSLQGEGHHCGRSAFFIRLAGCKVGCTWCDTKYSWPLENHPRKSIDSLAQEAAKAAERGAAFTVITGGEPLHHDLSGLTKLLADLTEAAGALLYGSGGEDVEGTPVPAPCSANVWRIHVKPGQVVKEGEAIVILEAMKMEYTLNAPCGGVVQSVKVKQGAPVKQGDVLLSIAEAAALCSAK